MNDTDSWKLSFCKPPIILMTRKRGIIVRGLSGTSLLDPTSEPALPSPPQGSIWHRNSESRKCATNNFWTKNRRGGSGEGLGGHARLFMLGFSPIFEVFSGPPTGLTQIIFGTANRPNINKWPGAKFGKISLNYLDLWHFSPPQIEGEVRGASQGYN